MMYCLTFAGGYLLKVLPCFFCIRVFRGCSIWLMSLLIQNQKIHHILQIEQYTGDMIKGNKLDVRNIDLEL